MEVLKQCIATRLDIFCMGVLLGVVSVFVGQYSVKLLELWLGNNQKKLDLELHKALAKMRENRDALEKSLEKK